MGAWGPKLYQDDTAQDVRYEYKELLQCGKGNEEATKELINDNHFTLTDLDDAPIFWFALADTQWDLGRLLPYVKEKAIEYLKNGDDLKRWEEECSEKSEVRRQVLMELERKLNSPLPKEKKILPYKFFKTEWENGDTFAYKLESDYAKEKGFYGRFLIIHKVDEDIWERCDSGDVFPIVYVKMTHTTDIPKNLNDVDNSDFIKMSISDRKKKSDYRQQNVTKSKKFFNKLLYIGNYINLKTPVDEDIKEDKGLIVSLDWNWKDIENRMIDNYFTFKDRPYKDI